MPRADGAPVTPGPLRAGAAEVGQHRVDALVLGGAAISARAVIGRNAIVNTRAVVEHLEGVSHGTDPKHGIKAYQDLNRDTFVASETLYALTSIRAGQ